MVKPTMVMDGAELTNLLSSSWLNRHNPVTSRALLMSWHWLVFMIILQGTFPERKLRLRKIQQHTQGHKAINTSFSKIRNTWSAGRGGRENCPSFQIPRHPQLTSKPQHPPAVKGPPQPGRAPTAPPLQTFWGSATQDMLAQRPPAGRQGGAPWKPRQIGRKW